MARLKRRGHQFLIHHGNFPEMLIVLNSVSLALALTGNAFLLLNFAHRVRYSIAQVASIFLWLVRKLIKSQVDLYQNYRYIAAVLLIIPLGLTHMLIIQPRATHAFSQSYYYAIISATIYMLVSSLLVVNAIGAYLFKAYPPSFSTLTIPQRTLMLQTITYILYLALGAGIFSTTEGWQFLDTLYWADYTLLTIGLGSDFALTTTVGRALLIPYAACGITMLGLVIGSIRALVLERAKVRVVRRCLTKQRQKHVNHTPRPRTTWRKDEFESMRRIQRTAETIQQYSALCTSFFVFLVVWVGGALAFWFTEMKTQSWTYFEALYFTYTTLLTIGFGDFYPDSNSGKPFFVVWSLIAVPAVTILISNMGDTLVRGLKYATLWLGERTILPEIRRQSEVKKRENEAESGSVRGLGGDKERLGEAVQDEEKELGKENSIATKIAQEIKSLAKDVGKEPPKIYGWDDWVRWLDLLGIKDESESGAPKDREKTDLTWLGDSGPLFSKATETEWILDKLCSRLGKVLEKELKDTPRDSNGSL
ncbi:hypothetical protein H0H81_002322 [Sphagnurus paluster]|uniref:Potassium channel domain-containing protein n=1 Tax=Sphagnurus paluster TaxID=117069 RepID=A0A9P7GUC0_9AGAR|nr:hypothetical protein H0H81_002322 [Sphagnurus paluster]